VTSSCASPSAKSLQRALRVSAGHGLLAAGDGGSRRDRSRSPRRAGSGGSVGVQRVQDCAVVAGHLCDWTLGNISTQGFRRHLRHTLRDNTRLGNRTDPVLVAMSKIGGDRSHSGNCQRDLLRRLAKTKHGVDVWGLITHVAGASQFRVIVKPHTLIQFLYSVSPRRFRNLNGIDATRIQAFWEGLRASSHGQVMFQEHRHLRGRSPASLRHTMPLVIHEDAAPFSKHRSVSVLSVSCLLAIGPEIDIKYVIAAGVKEDDYHCGPDDASWREILESFDVLAKDAPPDGPPGGINLFGKHDSEQLVNGWGGVHYNAAKCVCNYCFADRTERPWTDMLLTASWRKGTQLAKDVMQQRCRKPLHPLFQSNFFTRSFFRVDLMHAVDCKGLGAILVGSTLVRLVQSCHQLGTNQELRMDAINRRKRKYYQDYGVEYTMPDLKLANLHIGGDLANMACLSGPLVKAANTRGLYEFSRLLAFEFFDGDDQESTSIRKVNDSLCMVFRVLYSSGMFLNAEQLASVRKHTLRLSHNAATQTGNKVWLVTYKAHFFQHVPEQCELINLRYLQCYIEESLCGRISKIYKSSSNGPATAETLQHVTMIKYLVLHMLRACGYGPQLSD
jgi:hypothetical protein